jgi:hypothetical protein
MSQAIIHDYAETANLCLVGELRRNLGDKFAPASLHSPQISKEVTWDLALASVVKSLLADELVRNEGLRAFTSILAESVFCTVRLKLHNSTTVLVRV